MDGMESLINPLLVYGGIVLGAIAVVLAMPRKGVSPQLIGLVVGIAAVGLVVLGLLLPVVRSGEDAGGPLGLPSPFFYVFAAISMAAGLRVITHPRPVYAALYFILTILSSASLFIVIGAEFMGFALIIIYAGAILITYLFVIMLATQAPSEEQVEALSPYDAVAREPVLSTVLGFVLIAVLTGSMAAGVSGGEVERRNTTDRAELLRGFPRKVVAEYDRLGVFPALEEPSLAVIRGADGRSPLNAEAGQMEFAVADAGAWARVRERSDIAELYLGELGFQNVVVLGLPARLEVENAEFVGVGLIKDHPITLEIAGVILLMAMLGAVVLARKEIELTQAAKERAAGLEGDDDGFGRGADGGGLGPRDPATGSSVQRGRHVMVGGNGEAGGTH